MNYIIDASVAIKWFVPENLHEKALALLHAHGGNLEAPDFVLTEISNVAWKKSRQGMLSNEQARAILGECFECFAALHPTPELSERALDLAMDIGHPVYDCLYLACAELTGRTLVTADKGLCEAVANTEHAGFVLNIADWDEALLPLRIPRRTVEHIISLWRHVDMAALAINNIPGQDSHVLSPGESELLFNSLPMEQIKRFLDALSESERVDLLVLAKLGQGGESTDLPILIENTKAEIGQISEEHFMHLVFYLEEGLSKLLRLHVLK